VQVAESPLLHSLLDGNEKRSQAGSIPLPVDLLGKMRGTRRTSWAQRRAADTAGPAPRGPALTGFQPMQVGLGGLQGVLFAGTAANCRLTGLACSRIFSFWGLWPKTGEGSRSQSRRLPDGNEMRSRPGAISLVRRFILITLANYPALNYYLYSFKLISPPLYGLSTGGTPRLSDPGSPGLPRRPDVPLSFFNNRFSGGKQTGHSESKSGQIELNLRRSMR
jgi:hypothetical protein